MCLFSALSIDYQCNFITKKVVYIRITNKSNSIGNTLIMYDCIIIYFNDQPRKLVFFNIFVLATHKLPLCLAGG
jgi:hypothetical protein